MGYGMWVFPLLNFLKFNFLSNLSEFYGVHSFFWYLTSGIPTILLSNIPLFIFGVLKFFKKLRKNKKKFLNDKTVLLLSIVWMTFVYSFGKHKEFRFLFSILPITNIFCGIALHHFLNPKKKKKNDSSSSSSSSSYDSSDSSDSSFVHFSFENVSFKIVFFVFFLFLVNLFFAFYFSFSHQRGTVDLIEHIRTDLQFDSPSTKILFLMPCHSTPFYSHIHKNLTLVNSISFKKKILKKVKKNLLKSFH